MGFDLDDLISAADKSPKNEGKVRNTDCTSFQNVFDSFAENWVVDDRTQELLNKQKVDYEKKIKLLESKIDAQAAIINKLKGSALEGTSEHKVFENRDLIGVGPRRLFRAIKEEVVLQDREDVYIPRTRLMGVYKLNQNQIKKSREALENSGYIKIIPLTVDKNGTVLKCRMLIIKELPFF